MADADRSARARAPHPEQIVPETVASERLRELERRIGSLDDDLGLRLNNLSDCLSDYAYVLGLAGVQQEDKRANAIFFFSEQLAAITEELRNWAQEVLHGEDRP